MTKNMVVGESVYGEKRISVDGEDGTKTEYRVWNSFPRSKVAAGILGGLDNIQDRASAPSSSTLLPRVPPCSIAPTSSDLRASCTPWSSPTAPAAISSTWRRSAPTSSQSSRMPANSIRYPRCSPAWWTPSSPTWPSSDQARIVALNAQHFLKPGGNFIISIKAPCIDSTVPAEAVFAREVKKLQQEQFKPAEQLTLEPYGRTTPSSAAPTASARRRTRRLHGIASIANL